jgi:hypothetical protein
MSRLEAATHKAKVASRGSLYRGSNGTFVSCVLGRNALTDRIKKAGRHVSQNEGLIFEQSAAGKRGVEFPPLDVPAVDARTALGAEYVRESVEGFPEVSEIEVIRDFARLFTCK